MTQPDIVGFVGVGLMGWGMASNAVEKGFDLRVVAHRKREAVEDLVARGAVECADIAAMAAECDAIVLCVTGAPEVEAAVEAILRGAKPGLTIIDTSTSEPEVTARLARVLAERDITFFDAPLSRTPAHAWEGELTTFVAGPDEALARWRPLIATWASVIIPVGTEPGTAHGLKLVNNLVALGYAAIWSECYGLVDRLGVDPAVFREMISNSGMNCGNFQNYSKYIVDGDPLGHKFSIANAHKDLGYYRNLALAKNTVTPMSDAAMSVLDAGMDLGFGERFVPEMVDITLALNRQKADPAGD